jgi:hypothetical protein
LGTDVLPAFTYFDLHKIQRIKKTQKPGKKPEKPNYPCLFLEKPVFSHPVPPPPSEPLKN